MPFLSEEQMRTNLDDLKTAVEDKRKTVIAHRFSRENDEEASRQDALVDVLRMISSMGVDFGNPESVQNFLVQLEQSNPDLFQLFEEAMNGLLGPEAMMQSEAGAEGAPPNMNYEQQTQPPQGAQNAGIPPSGDPTLGGRV